MEAVNTLFGLIEIERTPYLIQVLVFITSVFLVYGLFLWLAGGEEPVRRRLREIKEGVGEENREPHKEGIFNVSWVEPLAKIALPSEDWKRSAARKRLVQAGFREERTLRVFYGTKVLLAFILPIAIVVPMIITGQIPTVEKYFAVFLLVFMALIGFYLPHLYLYSKIKDRKLAFIEGFPDALDMLVVCVEAGLGLDAAIQRVGHEMALSHPELAEEFGILSLELRAGKSREEALSSLAERTGVEQVQSLVSILIQAEHFGTSIATALREHAAEMREIRIQTAKERAAKLPVKMLFPIMFFIFPALFIVVLAPAAIQIFIAIMGGQVR